MGDLGDAVEDLHPLPQGFDGGVGMVATMATSTLGRVARVSSESTRTQKIWLQARIYDFDEANAVRRMKA